MRRPLRDRSRHDMAPIRPVVLRTRPRRHRLRTFLVTLVGVPLLAFAVGSLIAVMSGRTIVPILPRDLALQSLAGARQAASERWAPELFSKAETSFDGAALEQLRQARRLIPFQNFHAVAKAYEEASELAQEAQRLSLERRAMAMALADSAMAEAQEELAIADEVSANMLIPHNAHMRLQDAHMALEEARVHHAVQEYAVAESLAKLSCERAAEAWRLSLPAASRFTDRALIATWRAWVNETIAWSRQHGQPAIVIYKEKNLLVLYDDGKQVRSCRADMGRNNLQPKLRANDRATPEGRYRVTKKKDVGDSRYHRALLLDYPNPSDRERFARMKRRGELPASATIGAWIEIHGEGGKGINWTRGCVAVSNADMDFLFRRVVPGTPVTIVGGDGEGGAYSDIVRRLGGPAAERQP